MPQSGWDSHVHVFDAAAPVRPGHYQPVQRSLVDIEHIAAEHGIGHLVLVQPSVYGSDCSVLLRALRVEPGRHRGVVVVEPTISEPELDVLHAAGVRGVRFNRVSPAGHAGAPSDLAAELRLLAPRLRERGWFCQWYVPHERLPQLAEWQAETGLTFVLDHLAGLTAGLAADAPAWPALEALAASGSWIKLSGWYRLGAAPPYAELVATVRRVAALFGPRLLWGSDWPHTSFAPAALPRYETMLEPVRAALGELALQHMLHEPPRTLCA